ncbi:MAG: EamA family transporter [Chthoniobacterales bacterium]
MWIFFALAAAIIWGINYAASGRVLSRGMSPSTLFFIDTLFALLLVSGTLIFQGKTGRIITEVKMLGGDIFWLVTAMCCATAAALLILMAIEGKNATVASLIEVSYPLFVAVFAWLFFRELQLSWQTAIGGMLILLGVFVVWRSNP